MAKRTKSAMAGSRSKGRMFERSSEASLKQKYPNIYMTHERGYIQQYDLRDDDQFMVYECKKHRSISWNAAKKYFKKLESLAPPQYESVLLFQSNRQPVLVMHRQYTKIRVSEFEDYFRVPFIKYTPIRRVKKDVELKNIQSKENIEKDRVNEEE